MFIIPQEPARIGRCKLKVEIRVVAQKVNDLWRAPAQVSQAKRGNVQAEMSFTMRRRCVERTVYFFMVTIGFTFKDRTKNIKVGIIPNVGPNTTATYLSFFFMNTTL